jgi:hypothetical protein
MMTDQTFEQQFDWKKEGLGFDSQLHQLATVRALRVAQLVKQSNVMREMLSAQHVHTTPQWVQKLTSPHIVSRLNHIQHSLHQFNNVVKQIESYQNMDLHTRLDSIDQKFVTIKHLLPKRVFSWFQLDYVKEHRSKPDLLTRGYVTDTQQLTQEEFAFVNREDIDARYIRRHMPDPLHRRMHFLYLYCKQMQQYSASVDHQRRSEAEHVYQEALEQYALHQPTSFASFLRTFEQDQQWMEANVYSAKSQFTWGSVLFDTCMNILGADVVTMPNSLTRSHLRQLDTFFSTKDTQTILTEDFQGLNVLKTKLQYALRQGTQGAKHVLDRFPDVVVHGDNPLYWTNTNKNANHAHFSQDTYEHWFTL